MLTEDFDAIILTNFMNKRDEDSFKKDFIMEMNKKGFDCLLVLS